MIESEREDGVEAEGPGDRRRARLADLQRVEAAIVRAEARLAEMERLLEGRESSPISRSQFYAQIYANSALAGKSTKFIRNFADDMWASYCEAMANAPRKTIADLYGGGQPESVAAAPAKPEIQAPGIAKVDVTAELAKA